LEAIGNSVGNKTDAHVMYMQSCVSMGWR